MAPSRNSQKEKNNDSSDDGQLDSQQSHLEMLMTAREMVDANKKRRAVKRKAIEEEHINQVKDVSAGVNALFEARKSKVHKAQKQQWARLDALNKRRTAIEAQILASMKTIELHSANIISEMTAMFDGRVEDLKQEGNNLDGTTLVNN
ncbi:hypothetical protein BJ878DRAFT_500472 [Calycina marina]|uniref:Uncharacterized protein n=1 Tax=Calycina marina TaxID=1763456 RepID=A0A9P8CFZ0_9HELO|nr:hypothetical protein BJ878DRAFT_500472 [Calycina marina]